MKINLSILILLFSLNCYAQETRFQVFDNLDLILNTETIEYDSSEFYLLRMNIVNNSDFSYLFWFSEIKTTGKTQKELIQDHFYKRKGDFNLIELASKNITKNTKLPKSVFAVYTKVINQNMTFIYNINVKNHITTEVRDSIQSFILDHAVIIPEKITREYFDIKTVDKVLDKSNSSFMDWKGIKRNIQN